MPIAEILVGAIITVLFKKLASPDLIRDTPKLKNIPLGIEGLTGLRTLSKVIVGNGFKISNLNGLLHLQGQLSIQGLQTVIKAIHAKEANLVQKKGLRDIEMIWSDVFDDSRNEINEYEVHDKVKILKIL
ncbi:hypothetical protein L6452_42641 [Arctium lappa]|uniref:Uncharacterized protein n=1 Tax=Arctium lappa TaxID=4217 RepID=A0ACB8XKJ9_ARCLA|nr:hypothetical protein L6452_42641 [Arctium lappa]